MTEPKIERYEVVTPSSCVGDDYGNLTVKGTAGEELRVNKKHEHLHSLFEEATQEGRALKLGYAVYMDKEYVHTAELFDGKPPEGKRIEPIKAGIGVSQQKASPLQTQLVEATHDNKERTLSREEAISRAVALKATVDLICVGKVGLEDWHRRVSEFRKYLDGVIE